MSAWVATAVALAFAFVSLASIAPSARAQNDPDSAAVELSTALEPPPEAAEGADYEAEPADSVEDGSLEMGFGALGRQGGSPRRTRRVRFSGGDLRGSVRDGTGDPLAGSAFQGRAAGGSYALGRLSPRWGRGLLIGAPADPWSARARDRGSGAAFRGRAGEGLHYRLGEGEAVEVVAGRFSRRDLGGMRARAGPLRLGALAGARSRPQASAALEGASVATELAMDRAGRWRAEAATERSLRGARVFAHARGGLAGFRSLAEPGRGGPSRALAVSAAAGSRTRASALASAWRFAPGAGGARLALEVERRLAHHGALAVGFEEQHGVRRLGTTRGGGFRQGLWSEWSGGTPVLALGLRQEVWGSTSRARNAVRTVSAAQVEALLPAGARLRVTHTAYRVSRGESLYLAEAESDRLVLRSLSGSGERTRLELAAPAGGGLLRASLALATTLDAAGAPGATAAQWTLDWSRRARMGRGG